MYVWPISFSEQHVALFACVIPFLPDHSAFNQFFMPLVSQSAVNNAAADSLIPIAQAGKVRRRHPCITIRPSIGRALAMLGLARIGCNFHECAPAAAILDAVEMDAYQATPYRLLQRTSGLAVDVVEARGAASLCLRNGRAHAYLTGGRRRASIWRVHDITLTACGVMRLPLSAELGRARCSGVNSTWTATTALRSTTTSAYTIEII